MKIWFKAALVLCLVVLVGITIAGCGGGEPGPEDAVRGMFKAMEAKDAEKIGEYCTEDIREDVVAIMEMSFELIDSMKVRNLELTVASETENTATVDFECDYEIEAFGETETSHESDSIDLEKVDGKWLISEPPE
jgi:hypothetical protein